jgi:hypothetical protein
MAFIILLACHTPNAPQDLAGTVVPENAVYSFAPDSAFAIVSFDLHVTNKSYDRANLMLCLLALEQRNNKAAEFENVFHARCSVRNVSPELLAHSDTTFHRSIIVDKARAVKGSQYRASVVLSFGLRDPTQVRIQSLPFEPELR